MKKIKLMHYKLGNEICYVDYNKLRVHYINKTESRYNLLGAISDRIESFLIRRGYEKITQGVFDKLKEKIDGAKAA